MFVDEIKVTAKAGHGGKGCVAFLRETFRPKGGPSGGNGGRGGNVILEADHDLNNLLQQFYQSRLFAESGTGGMGKGMDGPAGKDLVIKVPCGTLVWRLPDSPSTLPEGVSESENDEDSTAQIPGADENQDATEPVESAWTQRPRKSVIRTAGGIQAMEINMAEEDLPAAGTSVAKRDPREKGVLVCDLIENGQRWVLCKGGRGGLGNRNFATSRRQTPRFAQPGELGEEGNFLFELRMLADVGIVGYPNAGKSTLLAAVSKARPRIAPYPFTTLTPQVGILEYPDWKRLTVCDVPGLIAGAHENVGLGHAFLRHIERCAVLVILLDMAGTDERAPWDDYQSLLDELGWYNPGLLERPRLVVANKMDESVAAVNLKSFKRRVKKTPVLEMAAGYGEGVEAFKAAIRKIVEKNPGDRFRPIAASI